VAVELTVDGHPVVVENDRADLLTVLRDQCGITSVKDGCAPQGQCGCCTVLIDGQARVACVTPVRRIAGRDVRTIDGLAEDERNRWAAVFAGSGASQCGFCTPGIICRLSALQATGVEVDNRTKLDNALAAHLCRCTGWQTIREAWVAFPGGDTGELTADAATRSEIEGRTPQHVGADVALGRGGFSADTSPAGALVAVPTGDGAEWVVGPTLAEARTASGKVQGRRTTAAAAHPIAIPEGEWALALQTAWVEPAALETETVWCEPGGEPSSLLANGGAFGAKADLQAELGATARRLADEHGEAVRLVLSREDSVRLGVKRPPMAAGVRVDGSGVVHVARTPGIAAAISRVAPTFDVIEVDVPGPPTSASLRGAGWLEAAVLVGAHAGTDTIDGPDGGRATASFDGEVIRVSVDAGAVLDPTVLRSYCIGAAHMGYSLVISEQLAVADDGTIGDLTVRSFGIVRSADMPHVEVSIEASTRPAVNGSDAVFAAVALATWRHAGLPARWPTGQ
jgi:aerobic-type carbon monoxide dehydrogenase small subunit (CoxS/CutS family)